MRRMRGGGQADLIRATLQSDRTSFPAPSAFDSEFLILNFLVPMSLRLLPLRHKYCLFITEKSL